MQFAPQPSPGQPRQHPSLHVTYYSLASTRSDTINIPFFVPRPSLNKESQKAQTALHPGDWYQTIVS